ncbi:hypothetical protein [Parasitella parasitica]|uniref:Uncharacterized protein n=1 Tax=Parasitella parasitica TaxID=35722 RepID=A0A0B7NED0_9FUNG|nr:hypothetical protein [Parasitella parasitica]
MKIPRPNIVGSAPRSVFIEITNITNFSKLKTSLASFNECNTCVFYEALPQPKTYFPSIFSENCWYYDTSTFEQLITLGLEMDGKIIIKGYPSLDADARVTRVTLSNLPIWYHPRTLRSMMEKRSSKVGEVLDVGQVWWCRPGGYSGSEPSSASRLFATSHASTLVF